MRSYPVLGGLALLLAACAQPVAQGVAPQSAPAVAAAPRADGLHYFVGAWTATAKDPSTGEETLIDYRVEPVAGGAWLRARPKVRTCSADIVGA